jgi:phenylacetate-CoA ligase
MRDSPEVSQMSAHGFDDTDAQVSQRFAGLRAGHEPVTIRRREEMNDYELLRQRHLADAMALAPVLIGRLGWTADRLAAHRAERLRGLVRHAVERSAWHRERLAGLDVNRLDETSLRELPAMTKTDLMANFDRIVTDERLSLKLVNAHLETVSTSGYFLGGYTAITSGGSSGERGVFVYDWDGWAAYCLGLFRYLLRGKAASPELASRQVVVATVMAAHFAHATAAIARTLTGPQLRFLQFPVTQPIGDIVAGLNQAQPDVLLAYPSALHVLSFEARAGRLQIAPRVIRCGAEPLLPEIRAAAEQIWGIPVGNVWGTSEGGGTAVPCGKARSHLSEDLLIVEPVDERGRPVPPGQRSAKVYLTNLYNQALPLIRYEITDEVTVLDEPCPCGSAHRCVADIQGRLDDVFVYHGRRVHPHVFRSALGHHAGVAEYQVLQTENGARIAVRCGAPVDLQALGEEITDALAKLGVASPFVQIETVDRLHRDPGPAKLKRFVPVSAKDYRDQDSTQDDQEALR